MVSWPDALAYARWLDARLREDPETPGPLREALVSGARVTVPNEAEWEKAARGGDGRIYPWGDRAPEEQANFGGSTPASVGSHPCPACSYGLADMSGNVWEWTRSPYRPYPFDPSEPPADLAEDALYVMRGGSFADNLQNVRAAVRGGADPGARRPFIGFRVVIDDPPT
jgi:formylglycine-generating enzyme required for sulfatase activity